MRIFVDSGKASEIEEVRKYLNIDGITTNPTTASVEDGKHLAKIFRLPISVQPDWMNLDLFWKDVELLSSNPLCIVKVSINQPQLIKMLVDKSIKVNATLCFSLSQVITAVNLDCNYLSIFVGRMIEQGADPIKLIRDSVDYIKRTDAKTKIIAASIRSNSQFEIGSFADIVTAPAKVLERIYYHEMTDKGEVEFAKAFMKK